MRLHELTTSLTRSQLGVWAGDTIVRFKGSSRSCFTAWRIRFRTRRSRPCPSDASPCPYPPYPSSQGPQ